MQDILEGDGSMLGPRTGSFVGFQDCQKLIWWERVKKLILWEKFFWREQRIGNPTKNNVARMKNLCPDKNYSGRNTYYK